MSSIFYVKSGLQFNADGGGDVGSSGANRPNNVWVKNNVNIASLTASTALASDGSGNIVSSSTTATELGYVHGVTSSIQTQLNNITGAYITSLTGDVTATGPGAAAATLATVNSNTGSFGSSTAIPTFTVNGKGLITAASTNAVIAPAGTLTGTTLASNVVTSSLTTVGTIGTGTWQGSTIAIAYGGTGTGTAPTQYGVIYAASGTSYASTSAGTAGYVLTSNGTSAPTFQLSYGANAITALTGDATATGPGSAALTLATVNTDTGSFGSSTAIPTVTVNGKGLITAVTTNAVVAPAGTLTGTTLASNVVTSSLTSLGTQAQALNMGSNQINDVATPTSSTDAATKGYVDSAINGLYWKTPVEAYSDSNVPLTGSTPLVIDGYTVLDGDRLILSNQTTSSQNGVYSVAIAVGAYTLTATDTPATVGDAYLVLNGTNYGDSAFTIQTLSPTIFVQFAGPGELTFTSPLSRSGNTITLNYTGALQVSGGNLYAAFDNSTIDLNGSNQLEVKAGGITNTQVNASAAIAYSKLNLSNSIVNADINSSAAIAYSKLAALTANRALQSDGSGFVSASSVTSTELGYVSGVTSAIQTQLNGKANTALSNLASTAINTNLLFGADNTNNIGAASSASRPANIYVGTLVETPKLQGGEAAGDNDGVSGTPAVGNLYLSSTSNAAKGGVRITDGSAFIVGNSGMETYINTAYSNSGGLPAYMYLAIDAGDSIYENTQGDFVLENWGANPYLTLSGSAGGSAAAITYLANQDFVGGVFFNEYNGTTPSDKEVGGIIFQATEAHSSSAFGNTLTLRLVKNGTTTVNSVMFIGGDGSMTMGGTSGFTSGVNLFWAYDGAGTIGLSGANRPDAAYIKTTLNLASLTASTILMSDSSKNVVSLANSTNGYVLTMVSGAPAWAPASFSPSSIALTQNHILVGNASNLAADVAMSGDVNIVSSGATTIEAIQGTTVSGTTGSGNVAFSASPTFTGTISAASMTLSGSLTIGTELLDSGSVTTTDATVTTLYTLALASNTSYIVTVTVVGRDTSGADRTMIYKVVGAYNESGTCALASPPGSDSELFQGGNQSWDASFSVTGTNLLLKVTGAAATTIDWKCSISIQKVS